MIKKSILVLLLLLINLVSVSGIYIDPTSENVLDSNHYIDPNDPNYSKLESPKYSDPNDPTKYIPFSSINGVKSLQGDIQLYSSNNSISIVADYMNSRVNLMTTGQSSNDSNKVAVSATDQNASFLFSKLSAGSNISLVILNPGANELVQINSSGVATDVNSSDIKWDSNDVLDGRYVNVYGDDYIYDNKFFLEDTNAQRLVFWEEGADPNKWQLEIDGNFGIIGGHINVGTEGGTDDMVEGDINILNNYYGENVRIRTDGSIKRDFNVGEDINAGGNVFAGTGVYGAPSGALATLQIGGNPTGGFVSTVSSIFPAIGFQGLVDVGGAVLNFRDMYATGFHAGGVRALEIVANAWAFWVAPAISGTGLRFNGSNGQFEFASDHNNSIAFGGLATNTGSIVFNARTTEPSGFDTNGVNSNCFMQKYPDTNEFKCKVFAVNDYRLLHQSAYDPEWPILQRLDVNGSEMVRGDLNVALTIKVSGIGDFNSFVHFDKNVQIDQNLTVDGNISTMTGCLKIADIAICPNTVDLNGGLLIYDWN